MPDPAIAVLPYGGRMGRAMGDKPVSELKWPLGCPERLLGKRVRDLSPSDHLIVFPKTEMHFQLNWHCPAQVSMMVVEPKVIHGHHLHLLRLTHKRFFRVFSYDRDFGGVINPSMTAEERFLQAYTLDNSQLSVEFQDYGWNELSNDLSIKKYQQRFSKLFLS